MKCSKCNAPLIEEAVYCQECGTEVSKTTEANKKCSKCKNLLTEEDIYCPECGTKVSKINKVNKKGAEVSKTIKVNKKDTKVSKTNEAKLSKPSTTPGFFKRNWIIFFMIFLIVAIAIPSINDYFSQQAVHKQKVDRWNSIYTFGGLMFEANQEYVQNTGDDWLAKLNLLDHSFRTIDTSRTTPDLIPSYGREYNLPIQEMAVIGLPKQPGWDKSFNGLVFRISQIQPSIALENVVRSIGLRSADMIVSGIKVKRFEVENYAVAYAFALDNYVFLMVVPWGKEPMLSIFVRNAVKVRDEASS